MKQQYLKVLPYCCPLKKRACHSVCNFKHFMNKLINFGKGMFNAEQREESGGLRLMDGELPV